MLTCPRCGVPLRSLRSTRWPTAFACPSCAGRATTVEALRPYAPPEGFAALVDALQQREAGQGKACPGCRRPMHIVDTTGDRGPLELDLCRHCRLVWFDPTEPSAFAPPRDLRAEAQEVREQQKQRLRDLPQEALVLLARAEAEAVARQASPEVLEETLDSRPDQPWQWIPAVLGLPIEVDGQPMRRWPLATWTTGIAIGLLALLALADPNRSVAGLGLLPADPWRLGGLTWVSALVVHGSFWHLLSNLYFLLLAGDDVEQVVGPWRWLALFLCAGLAGNAAHALLDPRPSMPLVGASGAISGLIAFYALRFPRARMALAFRLFWQFAFLKVPVLAAAGFWLLLQVLGALSQRGGCTRVSFIAHLGGFLVGVLFFAVDRLRATRPMPGRPRTPDREGPDHAPGASGRAPSPPGDPTR